MNQMEKTVRQLEWTFTYDALSGQPVSLYREGIGEIFTQKTPTVTFLPAGRFRTTISSRCLKRSAACGTAKRAGCFLTGWRRPAKGRA